MSEQTENLYTTDACESLRARLAKYENAEGRPLQRGGVVLSDEELWSIRNQVAIHEVLRDDDSVKICVKHGRAVEQAVLERLNSFPVSAGGLSGAIDQIAAIERSIDRRDARLAAMAESAGGVDERAAFEAWARREGIALWRNQENKEKYYCGAAQQAWESWQKRATCSDDSHNFKNFHRLLCERFGYTHDGKDWRRDQVSLIEHIAKLVSNPYAQPAWLPCGYALVPVEPTPEMLAANIAGGKMENRADLRPMIYRAMLAAAPSAVSQEQGE